MYNDQLVYFFGISLWTEKVASNNLGAQLIEWQ